MQKELDTSYPALRIQLLGVNASGQEAGNGPTTEGRELPWLQDVDANQDGRSDAGTLWSASYRDVYILDGANVQVAAFDVESKDLEQPANYAALRDLLVDAAMTSQKPWRNADNPLDVNADDKVEPLDALIIINKLNAEGPHVLPPPQAGDPPMRFYDCNGDGEVAALDALNVINHLNGQNAAAGGEGEGTGVVPVPAQPAPESGTSATPPQVLAGLPCEPGVPARPDSGDQSRVGRVFESHRTRATAGDWWDSKTRPTLHDPRTALTATVAAPSRTHPRESMAWWFAGGTDDESVLDVLALDAAMQ